MLKTILALALAVGASAVCVDDPLFIDETGNDCTFYASASATSCFEAPGISLLGRRRLMQACGLSCGTCVKANDFCEIGTGGDQFAPVVATSSFDFFEQPALTDNCNWIDSPQGLQQTTNAWGNTPGENVLLGCVAVLKDATYTDFIMEVEAVHEDNDASGIIFGIDPAAPFTDNTVFYQVHMMNDAWPDEATDGVPGPHLKFTKKNGLPCLDVQTVDNDCYDMLEYSALDVDRPAAEFPNGRLQSVDFFPEEYYEMYDFFKQDTPDSVTVRFTLVVKNGEARVYFMSRNNKWVGLWTALPADYVGGKVGLWMSAHQATYKSITIVDVSDTAAPMTNMCKQPGATCDTTVGLCLGGPTFAPTSSPTASPTYFENCQDPFVHPAVGVCPSPVGGAVTTVDTTDITNWELIDQPLISVPCEWSADSAGLAQTTNAWGNWPTDQSLLGCIAMIGDASLTFTDFIAEYEAEHLDNDAWGFVFGYKSQLDHYVAHTINDVWPSNAIDGIPGPNSKIRKTNGNPCAVNMNESYYCYDTLGYTDANGYSDYGSDRVDGPRSKEYEYTHPYAASAEWQPHKITLIVQGQEARILFKSPDTFLDTPINNVRSSNRYQAGMTFDLQGYTGGRIGIWMYAHQMIVSNFKVTDISDPANMPTAYCGGDEKALCDVGVTGLCLAVAASGACEGAVGATEYDLTNLDTFEYIDDPGLNGPCLWNYGERGFVRQSSNANNNDGTLLGCNGLIADEYTNFVAEMTLDNQDNDGIGFDFGWKSDQDFFRVHKINDVWSAPPYDSVGMPVMKVRRRIAGVSLLPFQNASNAGFQTIGYIDQFGFNFQDAPVDSIMPAGECGYSTTYLQYDQAETSKMYLIVKDGQMRATYESPLSRRQVTVMVFDLNQYGYAGGRIGVFMAAHQAELYRFSVAPLTGANAVTQFCKGDICSDRTGRCLGSPTLSPTFMPTMTPTTFPTPNVAANMYCQGPVSTTATTMVDATDITQFDLVAHDLLTTDCAWTAGADGLSQTSEAWGNAPGDNTLMGCMAIYNGATFTDFIVEIDVTQIDNDGWGVVFGYNSPTDHYLGIAMNDRWPQPAADGIAGPFLKMKKHNGKPTLPQMDASNTCFDTLAHLDFFGFNKDAMQGASGVGLPKEYESTYPYRRGQTFTDTKIVLIVAGGEARMYYPTPDADQNTPDFNLRQKQTMTAVWTFDLAGYTGGQVGVFTYAHQATFYNWKVTDLSDPAAITAYCDGDADMYCDNERGPASTGLCMAVPASDVCEGPIGESVVSIDTRIITAFEFIDDPVDLTDVCDWSLGQNRNIRQNTNAFFSTTLLLGCNALVTNMTFTDFVMQADIINDDNDAAGFNFGWQSIDDHFRLYKMNDAWPNPSADSLPGPIMKVIRKKPGVNCSDAPFANASASCYATLAFIDQYGVFHNGMPVGAVAPFEYTKTYVPFVQADTTRLVLIVRNNVLRVMYEDPTRDLAVGAFVFDLTPWNYVGGQVGLHVAAHQAEFSDLRIAPLTGPEAVTQFCNGGVCNSRTGLCTTAPTLNPTSRSGDIALPDICPVPVGGNTISIDTLDLSQFSFVDQEPLSEPCAWAIDGTIGLRQTSNAWGNYPGSSTVLGCLALIGSTIWTDFMVEVTSIHDDDDAWGFVFGYDAKGVVPEHYMAMASNAKWPDPAMDGVRGPFSKIKKTNGKPCVAGPMNATADNMCYDTLSFSDYQGRFVVDGLDTFDLPGEYTRRYPYFTNEIWPTRKMTLIVKDGMARLMVLGPEKNLIKPINNMRQPTQYVSTWTTQLDDLGYAGGQIGLMVNAHKATFYDLMITDLSDPANLPTDYCGGNGTCADGVCTSIPVANVCEDPVGATVIDFGSLNSFDYVDDPEITTAGPCNWLVSDLGNGPFLYQSSNAHGSLESIGCNAIYNGGSYTDFVFQIDVDNYDNDGVGMIFGFKSLMDHFKIHKRVDVWPSPSADQVEGPNFKVSKRNAQFPCVQGMNETNACYNAVAWSDALGVFTHGRPADTVAPWQYATRYFDYEIGLGVPESVSRMVLMVKNNELRAYFTSLKAPELKVGAMAYDLSPWQYSGGSVGVFMFAHQAQFLAGQIASLNGNNAATEFCANGGACSPKTGLCE